MPAADQRPGTTRTLVDGVRRTVIPGGLRVVTEQIPTVRSAAVGVFVAVGSRDETARLNGASHFLEHLLFKGTPERTAMEISSTLEGVGGEFNAYTSREYTCYHARVLDADLPLAIDVLGDMITSSVVSAEDVEAEREVILDEIAMHDDDPDDLAHNLWAATAWAGNPLSRPVAGTAESIRALNRSQIFRYYRSRYTADAMTVAVAGNVDHATVVRQVKRAFSRNKFLADAARVPRLPRLAARPRPIKAGQAVLDRQFEQAVLVLGMRGITRSDDRRYPISVLNAVLGGGASSRLFQEVREKRGLAYGVHSFVASNSDSGTFGIGAGSLPDRAGEVLRVIREVLAETAESGISEDELTRVVGQLRGGIVLGLEDTGSRMTRLGESELFQPRLVSLDETLERIGDVTLAEVNALAADVLRRPQTLAVVAPKSVVL